MTRRAALLLIAPATVIVVCAALAGLLLGTPRIWAIDLAAPEASRFIFGFELPETSPGGTFRWSGPEARLIVHGAGSGHTAMTLRLNGDWLNTQGKPRLTLARGDEALTAFDLARGWRVYRVILPPGAAATPAGEATAIKLQSAMARPGVTAEGRDGRNLGVPTATAHLKPLDSPSSVLGDRLARGLRVGWLLAIVVGLALALDMLLLPGRRAGAWWRATALALALGGGLVFAAWTNPVLLAWAVPPTPWLLGLLTAAAGGFAVVAAAGRLALPRGAVGWGALGLLACGQLLLHTQTAVGAGLALAVAGLYGLLAVGLGASGWRGLGEGWSDLRPRAVYAGLAVALLAALAMRLWRLGEVPFGLWRDEARHGLFALRILEDSSYRPIYIAAERVNMPALGLYPFAAALGVFGPEIWAMRVVTAVAGALTVLPLYGLTYRLTGRRDLGLLAAALLAVSSWHVGISRFSFPTVFDPLFGLTGLWLILVALGPPPEGKRPPRALARLGVLALAGACLGVALQTYHTGRVVPVIAAGLLALLALRAPGAWRPALAGGAALAAGLGLVIWPYLAYALAQPAAFNDRVSDVFVLSASSLEGRAPLTVIDAAVRAHLLMFNAFGDVNARHHAPGRPLLDYLSGLGFLAGCAVALRAWRDWRSHFLLLALALSVAPSALAVNAPHAMRSFGAASFAYLVAAVGWASLAGVLGAAQWARRSVPALGGALAAVCLTLNAWLYFVWLPSQPEYFVSFYPVQSRVGAYLRDVADREGPAALGSIYVQGFLADDPVLNFLGHGLGYRFYDLSALGETVPPGGRFITGGYFPDEDRAKIVPLLGEGAAPVEVGPPFPDGRGPTYYVYRAP